jgi:tetratricopeptide (TPR) repeat protein
VVAGLAAALYCNTIDNGFVFDDRFKIGDEGRLADPRLARFDLAELFTTNYWGTYSLTDGLYRPLVNLSYAIDHAIFGVRPKGYHFENVLLHALDAVLVLLLATRLFRARFPALAAALLFAAHPIHTEAVANVVGRAELMAFGFSMAALLAFLRGREGGGLRWHAASVLLYFLALLSKETAAPLPVLMLAWEALVERRPRDALRRPGPYLALFGALVLLFVIRRAVLGAFLLPAAATAKLHADPLERFFPLAHLDAGPRVLTAFAAFARYAFLLVWPVRLVADWSFDALPEVHALGDPRALLGIAALVAILAGTAWATRRSGAAAWAGLVFLLTLLPVANFLFPVGTVLAERLLYFPSLGFCLLAAQGLSALRSRLGPNAGNAALIVVLLLYSVRTVIRNLDWKSEEGLWRVTAKQVPRNAKAGFNTGQAVLQRWQLTTVQGQRMFATPGRRELADEAAAHFVRAIEVDPNLMRAHLNLGLIHSIRKEYDRAEVRYRAAIAAAPEAFDPWNNLANDYLARAEDAAAAGRAGDALELDRKAVETLRECERRMEALLAQGYTQVGERLKKVQELRSATERRVGPGGRR